MSVIANYARVTESMLQKWCKDPQMVWRFKECNPSEAAHMDVDKACTGISWLLSETKRQEQEKYAVEMRADLEGVELPEQEEISGEGTCSDILLVGIEGRGDRTESRLDFGYGPACVLSPELVRRVAAALETCGSAELRRNFDPVRMDAQLVDPEGWQEDSRGLLERYIVPHFEALKQFYSEAACSGQLVVMFYS
jgi:hypothetical protein